MVEDIPTPKYKVGDSVTINHNNPSIPGYSYMRICMLGRVGEIRAVSNLTRKGFFYKLTCDGRWWHEDALKRENKAQITECEFMELLQG